MKKLFTTRAEIWDEIERIVNTAKENYILLFSARNIGKTYTVQKTVIEDCLTNGTQFSLVVPVESDVKSGALKKWVSKVMLEQFAEYECKYVSSNMYVRKSEDEDFIEIAHCYGLSAAEKLKKESYPLLRYMIMDEAMLSNPAKMSVYMDNFNTIYETFDRHRNIIKAIFLGNKLEKVNPVFDFFGVTVDDLKSENKRGKSINKMWWNIPTVEIEAEKGDAFADMIAGTNYGKMSRGEFITNYGELIKKPPADLIADGVISVNLGEFCYMMIVFGADGFCYVEVVPEDHARKYSQDVFQTMKKYATNNEPIIPEKLKKRIQTIINGGGFKFIDEESLLILIPKIQIFLKIFIEK